MSVFELDSSLHAVSEQESSELCSLCLSLAACYSREEDFVERGVRAVVKADSCHEDFSTNRR